MDQYLVKKGDFPRISDGFSEISVGSKGLTGVGQYEKEYNIELIANAQDVIVPPRKIPYAIKPKVKEALDGLKAPNIIADVDRPTDWLSNLVIAEKKSGALRLCLNPRPLNVAINRERHAIPTPGDV